MSEENTATQSNSIDDFKISIPMDGYDIEVTIGAGAIKRELQRLEERKTEEIAENGLIDEDLSRFTKVKAEPTLEKWRELADETSDTRETSSTKETNV